MAEDKKPKQEKDPKTGRFVKGNCGKVAGSKDHAKPAKKLLEALINGYLDGEQVQKDMKAMRPKDRAAFIVSLLPYYMPKMSSVAAVVETPLEMQRMTRKEAASVLGIESSTEEEE